MRGSPSVFHAKERAGSNQCKPFGLAKMGGSFTTYLQTSYYLKLPDKQLHRAEMSSNDPRPKLIITQASLRHQQSSTLIKVALPRRTREQPGSARQIGTLLQLHSSTRYHTHMQGELAHELPDILSVNIVDVDKSFAVPQETTCLQHG